MGKDDSALGENRERAIYTSRGQQVMLAVALDSNVLAVTGSPIIIVIIIIIMPSSVNQVSSFTLLASRNRFNSATPRFTHHS